MTAYTRGVARSLDDSSLLYVPFVVVLSKMKIAWLYRIFTNHCINEVETWLHGQSNAEQKAKL